LEEAVWTNSWNGSAKRLRNCSIFRREAIPFNEGSDQDWDSGKREKNLLK